MNHFIPRAGVLARAAALTTVLVLAGAGAAAAAPTASGSTGPLITRAAAVHTAVHAVGLPSIPGVGTHCNIVPEMPGRGAPSFLMPKPATPPPTDDPFKAGATTTIYQQYGLAGFTYNVCDLVDNAPDAVRPDLSFQSTVANWFFLGPQFVVGVLSGIIDFAYTPSHWMPVFYPLVDQTAAALHNAITRPVTPILIAIVGLMMIFGAIRWRLGKVLGVTLSAIIIIAGITAVLAQPATYLRGSNDLTAGVLGSVSSEMNGQQHVALTPSQATTSSAVDAILWRMWLAGEFGDPDSKTAKTYGPDLYRAQTYTWAEAKQVEDDPKGKGKELLDAKRTNYSDVMGKIKDADASAYESVTGRDPRNRVGYSLLAWLACLLVLPLLLISCLIVAVSYIYAAIGILTFVTTAIFGVIPGYERLAINPLAMVLSAMMNSVVFGAAISGTMIAIRVLLSPSNGLMWGAQLLILGMLSVAALFFLHPIRRLTDLAGGTITRRLARKGSKRAVKAAGALGPLGKAAGVAATSYIAARAANHHQTEEEAKGKVPPSPTVENPATPTPGPATVSPGGDVDSTPAAPRRTKVWIDGELKDVEAIAHPKAQMGLGIPGVGPRFPGSNPLDAWKATRTASAAAGAAGVGGAALAPAAAAGVAAGVPRVTATVVPPKVGVSGAVPPGTTRPALTARPIDPDLFDPDAPTRKADEPSDATVVAEDAGGAYVIFTGDIPGVATEAAPPVVADLADAAPAVEQLPAAPVGYDEDVVCPTCKGQGCDVCDDGLRPRWTVDPAAAVVPDSERTGLRSFRDAAGGIRYADRGGKVYRHAGYNPAGQRVFTPDGTHVQWGTAPAAGMPTDRLNDGEAGDR